MAPGTGRVALVKGGSAGIGEAAARALVGAGFTVYGTSRKAAIGQERDGVAYGTRDRSGSACDGSVGGER
jgi:NAD(P)-dependent dehydrogenase (short-subunit alcohol dehydrogenase family)